MKAELEEDEYRETDEHGTFGTQAKGTGRVPRCPSMVLHRERPRIASSAAYATTENCRGTELQV